MTVESIKGFLETQLERYLTDLARLVHIDSGSYHKAGANQINDWLEDRLSSLGFAVQRHPQDTTGDHLVASWRGVGAAKILLLGHSDTVYPPGTAAQRPLTRKGDRLLGPGTCDMKAGLLAGLYAIEALQQLEFSDFAMLTYLCVADEEIDRRTSISLIQETLPGYDAVLTLEAARENGAIVTERKGNLVFRVKAEGRSAHAGVEPQRGRNAIAGLIKRLIQVEALAQPQAGITINIGVVQGGTSPNVVPAHAQAAIDIRAFRQHELDQTLAAIGDIFAQSEPDGIRFTATYDSVSPPMPRTAAVAKLEGLAQQAARGLGFKVQGVRTGGAADSAFAAAAGVPALDGLGPIGGLDHSPDEYILKSSIVPRTALLAELMLLICGEKNG